MFSIQKTIPTLALLPLLIFSSQSTLAEVNITEKYAPYIGYQHGYSSYHDFDREKIGTKYTPRFFIGISPIQGHNYKIGAEIGYTLPASYDHQYSYYSYWEKNIVRAKSSVDVKNTDLYLTYYHQLTQNSHWFIKPGVEYYRRTFHYYENGKHLYGSYHRDSVYAGAKAGMGYHFNKNLAINALAGSRFYDLMGKDSNPIRFLFNLNAEYTF